MHPLVDIQTRDCILSKVICVAGIVRRPVVPTGHKEQSNANVTLNRDLSYLIHFREVIPRVPRHNGKALQPQNELSPPVARLAIRLTIGLLQVGH